MVAALKNVQMIAVMSLDLLRTGAPHMVCTTRCVVSCSTTVHPADKQTSRLSFNASLVHTQLKSVNAHVDFGTSCKVHASCFRVSAVREIMPRVTLPRMVVKTLSVVPERPQHRWFPERHRRRRRRSARPGRRLGRTSSLLMSRFRYR